MLAPASVPGVPSAGMKRIAPFRSGWPSSVTLPCTATRLASPHPVARATRKPAAARRAALRIALMGGPLVRAGDDLAVGDEAELLPGGRVHVAAAAGAGVVDAAEAGAAVVSGAG